VPKAGVKIDQVKHHYSLCHDVPYSTIGPYGQESSTQSRIIKSKMSGNKLTKEDVNNRISSRGIVLLGEYINSDTKTLFQCSEGHTWEAKPTNLIHGGNGCPQCSGNVPLTKEIVNERLADLGIVMLGDYVNSQTKSLFQNKEGRTWEATPANVMSSNDCQQRTGKIRLTKEIVNERLADRGIVMLDGYEHQKVKARFQCSQGHTWKAVPNNVLFGKGCPKCGSISAANKKRLTVDDVRNRLAGRGIDMVGEYVNSQTKTLFKCNEDHTWETTPNSVMGGRGCPHCYEKNLPLTKDIVSARIADRGITLLGDYMGAHVSTLFQCSEGHTWEARPNNIIQGKNCPHCDGHFPLSKEIVNERIAGRGLVMLGEYVNSVTTTLFQCSESHSWEASPGNVMAGTGCGICAGNIPLTTEIVNDRIADRGLVMLDEYINNTVKRRFQCSEGHVWETAPANVLSGRGCYVCADHTSDNDVFYLWIAGPQELVLLRDGEFLLKYGVTSERREDIRIREVGYAWNTISNVLALVKTNGPAIWAEKTATKIGRRLTSDYSHLDGWTEFRIVNDTELAQLMAIAAEAAEYKIVWNNPVPHIKEFHLEQLKFDLQW